MLRIIVGEEGFNDESQTFETIDPLPVDLEHSLVSLSKWESKHLKPFLSGESKTKEELFDYIIDMIQTPGIGLEIIDSLSQSNIEEIQAYIESPYSATTFGRMPGNRRSSEIITAELIYYWMVAFNIPFVCETWHLNRLFALIRICNVKNSKPEQMSRHDAAVDRARLNAERRERLGTKG